MLKRSSTRETIYAAKNLLVRTLYERGYCVRAVQQKQELKCWECNGTGGWDNSDMGNECWEPCYKCDATGVYAEHTLYKFTFRIGKRHYSWHQPTRLVTWDVALTSTDVGTFEDKPRKRMRSPFASAKPPSGTLQLPASARENARSAVTHRAVAR